MLQQEWSGFQYRSCAVQASAFPKEGERKTGEDETTEGVIRQSQEGQASGGTIASSKKGLIWRTHADRGAPKRKSIFQLKMTKTIGNQQT